MYLLLNSPSLLIHSTETAIVKVSMNTPIAKSSSHTFVLIYLIPQKAFILMTFFSLLTYLPPLTGLRFSSYFSGHYVHSPKS